MNSKNQSNTMCPRCKVGFSCGVAAGDESCWCFYFPRMMPIPREDTSTECACLCPNCLEERIMLGHDEEHTEDRSPK